MQRWDLRRCKDARNNNRGTALMPREIDQAPVGALPQLPLPHLLPLRALVICQFPPPTLVSVWAGSSYVCPARARPAISHCVCLLPLWRIACGGLVRRSAPRLRWVLLHWAAVKCLDWRDVLITQREMKKQLLLETHLCTPFREMNSSRTLGPLMDSLLQCRMCTLPQRPRHLWLQFSPRHLEDVYTVPTQHWHCRV